MEHRWGARARIDIPVQLDCGSQALLCGVLRDASMSGAFLCTAAQLELLTCVRVRLVAPQPSELRAAIAAHVVRRAQDGFGLEWTQLAPAAIVALLGDSGVRALGSAKPLPTAPSAPARPRVEPGLTARDVEHAADDAFAAP